MLEKARERLHQFPRMTITKGRSHLRFKRIGSTSGTKQQFKSNAVPARPNAISMSNEPKFNKPGVKKCHFCQSKDHLGKILLVLKPG